MGFMSELGGRLAAFNLLIALCTALVVFCMIGCSASIPVVVKFVEKERQYTTRLEVPKEADEIYQIVIREIEKLPDVKIIRKDNTKFSVEGSRAEQTTRITVSPAGSGRSIVTVVADAGKTWEESKDLAYRIVRRICDEVNMECQLVAE
jgi:hypothetical protein